MAITLATIGIRARSGTTYDQLQMQVCLSSSRYAAKGYCMNLTLMSMRHYNLGLMDHVGSDVLLASHEADSCTNGFCGISQFKKTPVFTRDISQMIDIW